MTLGNDQRIFFPWHYLKSLEILQRGLTSMCWWQIEDRVSVPLILVCPAQEIQSLQKLFSNNDYFAFDSNKVSVDVESSPLSLLFR
jgi:hypothetical protein